MIKEWIYNIASIVMAGVLLDIVLPSGNLRKYARFILGLVMMIVILNPILDMFDQLPLLEKNIASNSFYMDMKSYEYQKKIITKTQQDQLKEMFEKNIEAHVLQEVKKTSGYSDVKVKVEIDQTDDTQNMGKIKMIYMDIGKVNNSVQSIKPVDIHVDTTANEIQEQRELPDAIKMEQKKIIDHISDIYGIEPSKIHITWTGIYD